MLDKILFFSCNNLISTSLSANLLSNTLRWAFKSFILRWAECTSSKYRSLSCFASANIRSSCLSIVDNCDAFCRSSICRCSLSTLQKEMGNFPNFSQMFFFFFKSVYWKYYRIWWAFSAKCHLVSLFVLLPLRFDSLDSSGSNSNIFFRSHCFDCCIAPCNWFNRSMYICFFRSSSSNRRMFCCALVNAESKMPMWLRCSCKVARCAPNSISWRSLAALNSLSGRLKEDFRVHFERLLLYRWNLLCVKSCAIKIWCSDGASSWLCKMSTWSFITEFSSCTLWRSLCKRMRAALSSFSRLSHVCFNSSWAR